MIDRCKFLHNLSCEQVSDRIIELEDENAELDRRRRSLQADVERLSGIIHRQRKELSTMQYVVECRNDENAKLRKLVLRYVEYTSQDRCEGCVYKRSCNEGDVDECWQLTEIRVLARKLGIEVIP